MSMRRVITMPYKTFDNGTQDINLDMYIPENTKKTLPAILYFHGGGLTVGNRASWFPTWLHKRVISLECLFICADYRLIPSGNITGHDILSDIHDLFAFLKKTEFSFEESFFRIDMDRISVAGTSSGGLCAYLAAIHAQPRPMALLSMYGMGGDFMTPHYLTPKIEVFFRGRELLDPSDYSEYLYPTSTTSSPISNSPLSYHSESGFPTNSRMMLARLYLQLGTFLDFYTGSHSPSLSSLLRDNNFDSSLIPASHRCLFPQMNVSSDWPPTMFCHGSSDSAVKIHESQNLQSLLQQHDVPTQLVEFVGQEHSFDYATDAEGSWSTQFDRIAQFLVHTYTYAIPSKTTTHVLVIT